MTNSGHSLLQQFDVESPSSFRRNLQREGAQQKNMTRFGQEETTMAEKAASNTKIKLEDQYKPLGLKAVLAAALMCANDRKKPEAQQTKPKKSESAS
jgi:hypothetical protein